MLFGLTQSNMGITTSQLGRKMFTRTVHVPFVSPATLVQLDKVAPGIVEHNNIFLTDTFETARAAAEQAIQKTLEKYEYVSYVEATVRTKTGWEVTVVCSGD